MRLVQRLKDSLVNLGAGNVLTQTALRLTVSREGFQLCFDPEAISLSKDGKTILLRPEDLSFVPLMATMHDHFFQMLQPDVAGDASRIDFTKPRLHKYVRTGIELVAPNIAEDDSMPEYTLRFQPQPGMVVFDVGAHAGLTTVELSRMVGSSGHVFAFEPDNRARSYLIENLRTCGVENVSVSSAAIGEFSGEAVFSMDGTQAAGFVDSIVYSRPEMTKTVQVLTLADACSWAGSIPHFIKADIEGAELGMVRGSVDFLRSNRIDIVFETHRLRDGSFTHDHLKPLLSSAGYEVEVMVLGLMKQNLLFATPRATA